ncbi:MAG: hypothetical protein C5B60_04830 [Chloroflexi bacterium]|nr:MAG: hypothetical protein C5B60_04830 [Chloroflexota bacterium]
MTGGQRALANRQLNTARNKALKTLKEAGVDFDEQKGGWFGEDLPAIPPDFVFGPDGLLAHPETAEKFDEYFKRPGAAAKILLHAKGLQDISPETEQ